MSGVQAKLTKIPFIAVLAVNLPTEALAATTLIGGPDGIAAAVRGGLWPMHYGFAVLAIASASPWIWPYRSDPKAVTAVLGVLTAFHSGLFASLTLAGDPQVGQTIHGMMAVTCIVLFTQRARRCA